MAAPWPVLPALGPGGQLAAPVIDTESALKVSVDARRPHLAQEMVDRPTAARSSPSRSWCLPRSATRTRCTGAVDDELIAAARELDAEFAERMEARSPSARERAHGIRPLTSSRASPVAPRLCALQERVDLGDTLGEILGRLFVPELEPLDLVRPLDLRLGEAQGVVVRQHWPGFALRADALRILAGRFDVLAKRYRLFTLLSTKEPGDE